MLVKLELCRSLPAHSAHPQTITSTDRQTNTTTDRQTHRQTNTYTDKPAWNDKLALNDKQTSKTMHLKTEIKHIHRQRDIQRNKMANKHTNATRLKNRDRQTNKYTK